MVDGSSLLLDLDGVVVESVQRLEDGTRLVHVRTAPEWYDKPTGPTVSTICH